MRIVSLACSNTEIVAALGHADDLVGVDNHSDFPVELVSRLPRVGPDLEIDIDRVAALEPDLVLATLTVPGHERVVEQLHDSGLAYLAPEPNSLEDVYASIEEIGRALEDPPAAGRLVEAMRLEFQEPLEEFDPRPSVLIEWWPQPVIAPGRRSWVDDLIRQAGCRSPLGNEDVKSRPLTDEEVLEIDPDAIVLSWCGVAAGKVRPSVIYDNPLWRNIQAVRKRQVYCIPEALLGRPGPRLTEGRAALHQVTRQVARRCAGPEPTFPKGAPT